MTPDPISRGLAYSREMRHNTGMFENVRLFFSIVWVIAVGAAVAFGLAAIISWGGFLDYLAASIGVIIVSTIGVVVTSA